MTGIRRRGSACRLPDRGSNQRGEEGALAVVGVGREVGGEVAGVARARANVPQRRILG